MDTLIDKDNPPQDIIKWMKKLENCLTAAPKGVGLFFASGSIVALATDTKNRLIMTKDSTRGVDQEYTIKIIKCNLSTAEGDW